MSIASSQPADYAHRERAGGTADAPHLVFDDGAKLRAAITAVCFCLAFYSVLEALAYTWAHDANWSHGPIIPLFSIWFVYYNWERIRRLRVVGGWAGLPVMLAGLALYLASLTFFKFWYLQPFSMMVTLLGVIVLLCGLPVLKYALVPWAYLFFAIPLPGRTYSELTDPLRRLAATVAAAVLNLIPSLTAERAGSVIECMYNGRFSVLGVEDACSGMRSTITLCALGVAVAFMSNRPVWHRLVMIAMCVPIATLCNVMRVTITCLLYLFVDPKYAAGTWHTLLGLAMLMVAFGLFSGLGWLLNNILVEEAAPGPDSESESGEGGVARPSNG